MRCRSSGARSLQCLLAKSSGRLAFGNGLPLRRTQTKAKSWRTDGLMNSQPIAEQSRAECLDQERSYIPSHPKNAKRTCMTSSGSVLLKWIYVLLHRNTYALVGDCCVRTASPCNRQFVAGGVVVDQLTRRHVSCNSSVAFQSRSVLFSSSFLRTSLNIRSARPA